MAPTNPKDNDEGITGEVDTLIKSHAIVVFSKSTCPFCQKVKDLFAQRNLEPHIVELDKLEAKGEKIQMVLHSLTAQRTVPNVFINGRHVGGSEDTLEAASSGKLDSMINATSAPHDFEYDIIVIGGGSGGIAASKEATRLGKKVAVCDFVQPTPMGTSWGLGGTCVNVGCIPKKLMHQASLLGEAVADSAEFGWVSSEKALGGENKKGQTLDWKKMVEGVQNHIGSINWGYRVEMRQKHIQYLNEYATFVDKNTVKTVNKKGVESTHTAQTFIVAVGGRPRYPADVEGAKELAITSDDIFSLPYNPGKTLCVGASYISLECAGFLAGMGIETTVMVRSILLRGFDQQMANIIGDYMEEHSVNFIRECVPYKLERVEDGQPGKIKVYAKYKDGTEYTDTFNTVLFAVGRDAETTKIGLDKIGVNLNEKNGKVIVNEREQTNVENVYAIGDVLDGKLELTPVAIQAGTLLARRLCGISDELTDYVNVPTTVFTPLEYGCCGLSEDDAKEKYGKDNVEVYHKNFWPLEWTLAHRSEKFCYAKLLCVKTDDERVVGFHYLGPNAGEVTQGFAGMIIMGAKKADFDRTIGIHPTNAEWFTSMAISKSSGVDPAAAGC